MVKWLKANVLIPVQITALKQNKNVETDEAMPSASEG